MKSTSQGKYQPLIRMLEAFVAGERTSSEFVREMDAEIWASGLIEDDQFADLLMALGVTCPGKLWVSWQTAAWRRRAGAWPWGGARGERPAA